MLRTQSLRLSRDIKEDTFFYAIFIYGIIVSLVQMVLVYFNMKLFLNDTFQIVLYLGIFFIIKNIDVSLSEYRRIFWYLIAGLVVNSIYLFYNFYVLSKHSRETGFMDNPNYVALGLVVTLIFLILHLRNISISKEWLLIWGIILFSSFILIVTGSRTGLVILVIVGSVLLLFLSNLQRILLFFGGIILGFIFLFKSPNIAEVNTPLILIERLNNSEVTEDTRFFLWKGAIDAAQDSYFLGMGIGQFRANFFDYFSDENNRIIYNQIRYGAALSEHSDYFALLTGYGIIGLLLYFYFLFLSVVKNINYSRASRTILLRQFYQFNILLLISIAIFGLTSENFHNPLYWFLIAYSTKTIS